MFDTSFYLNENPDVKDAGVNPFEQYLGYAATDEIVRYPNQTAKSFGTSPGALVASADLSDSQFINFQDSASLLAEGNDEVAVAIPIVIVVGAKVIAFTAASLGIIKAASNIQELLEASQPEIFVPEGDIDPSIPPFDLSEVPRYDPERFPNNNDFLDDILDGQYEFPDAEEGGSYFLASESSGDTGLYTPDSADILLNSQENITLELFGGATGQLPGAINVDIIAEQGIRADLLTDGLSFIPSNSVDEIVTFNPFIPKDAGGTGILDYLPEAARTLEPGGQIIINGTTTNKFTKVKQSLDLESLGLRVVEKQIPLLDRFSDFEFRTIDGKILDKNSIKTTILEKI